MTHITTKEFKRDGATKETTLKKRDIEVQKRKVVFNRYLKKSLGQQLEFSAKSIKGKKTFLQSWAELSAWEGVDTKAQKYMWKSEHKSEPQSPWKYLLSVIKSHVCMFRCLFMTVSERVSDLVVFDVRHRVRFWLFLVVKVIKKEFSQPEERSCPVGVYTALQQSSVAAIDLTKLQVSKKRSITNGFLQNKCIR